VTAKSGTDVMILENIFAKNFSEKNWRFWLKIKLNYWKFWS
jgi:hypothetical protein